MSIEEEAILKESEEKCREPRKAKKYVYFDIKTGDVKFEYGGIFQYDISAG